MLWLIPALLVTGFSFYLLLFADDATVSATLTQLGIETGLVSTPNPSVRLELDLQAPVVIIVQTPAAVGMVVDSAEVTSPPVERSTTIRPVTPTPEQARIIERLGIEDDDNVDIGLLIMPIPSLSSSSTNDVLPIVIPPTETKPPTPTPLVTLSQDNVWPTQTIIPTAPIQPTTVPQQYQAPTPTVESQPTLPIPTTFSEPVATAESTPLPRPVVQPTPTDDFDFSEEQESFDESDDIESDDEDEWEETSEHSDDEADDEDD